MSREERKVTFNLILNVNDNLESFYGIIDSVLTTSMSLNLMELPIIKNCILETLNNYTENIKALPQIHPSHLIWMYQQILMYDISIKGFEK